MGRPNPKTKHEKRIRQKQKRSNSCATHQIALSSQFNTGISCINDTSLCHVSDLTTTEPNSSHNISNPTSPLLFSEPTFTFDNETFQAYTPSPSRQSSNPGSSHDDLQLHNSTIGDVDTDLIEMDLYDLYRKEDGKGYSNEYLHKCRNKLRRKVRQDRIKINDLQRQIIELKLESEREKERIRMFYETIAFGRSRTGRIVQSAMGTSSAAGKIMKHLKDIYSVDHDRYYQ